MMDYRTTICGVGGVMVNDKEEVLLVRQRRFSTGKVNPEWGYPGGLIDRGETI